MGKPSPRQWAALRSEFESGDYVGVEDFQRRYVVEKLSKTGRPGLEYLENVAAKRGWTKHANAPKIKAECERLSIEMYARLGLPPEGAAKAVVAAVRDMQTTRDELIANMKELAAADGSDLDADKLAKVVERGRAYLAEKRAAAPYLVEYHKVTGAYAPSKHEHSGKVSVANEFVGMSAAELIADAKQRIARVEGMLAKGPAPWQSQKQQ